MKRLLTYILVVSASMIAYADKWVKDAEPTILEVHYTRTEVYDTLHRDSLFFKDEMMLRIGKSKAVFCNVKRFYQDSLYKANPDAYWGMMAAEFDKGNPNVFSTLKGNKRSYLYKLYPENHST